MVKNSKTFLIIDSHALIHRAYHALPPMESKLGQPTNAVYGFTSVLIKVLKDLEPTHIVAAFDLPGPTFRHDAYKEYKGTRPEQDEDLKSQFELVRGILESFNIPVLAKKGFEADDVIGTVVKKLKGEENIKIIIVTGDLDTLQLVDGTKTVVFTLKRGVNDTIIYGDSEVRERFGGLGPDQMTDFKGLKGDPSDNIPGVPSVGDKTAITLLQKYGSIENLYKNIEGDEDIKGKLRERLLENKEQAMFSKELATIRQDVPVKFSLKNAEFNFVIGAKVKKALMSFGFKSLLRRLGKEEIFETPTLFDDATPEPQNSELEELYSSKVLSKKVYEIEKELTPVLKSMEDRGILIDESALIKLYEKISKELVNVHREVVKLAGEDFNLNSPQELGKIVFEKLKLGGARPKLTKTGHYSTNAAELEKIKDKHLIIALLLRYRELSKLKSTYLEALPKLLDPKDGRIHTTFKQFGTATGRLSSENPNMQNIPIKGEYGIEIRKIFIAPKDYVLVSADYSQVELRVAAALSGDKKMIKAFLDKEDIHTRTAAEIFNVSFNKVDKDMRKIAKTLNFGVLYGMGSRAFAAGAGVSMEEAKKFIEDYKAEFSGLYKFLESLKQQAYKEGYVETFWGRRRYLPELSSANPGMRAAGERMAVNMPIQGTATGDVVKAAMLAINKEIEKEKDITMILQVHDELLFEVKKDAIDKYIPIIRQKMESAIDMAVPLVVDVQVGLNWGEMRKV